jgi:hypothetical protein
LRALALPPLRPAAFFCAVVPPWDELPPEPELSAGTHGDALGGDTRPVTTGIPAARRALARGATAEALVYLWNELEPARLSGERGRLNELARLAEEVSRRGDDADRHEAERFLGELRELTEAPTATTAPATAVLDAEIGRPVELPGEPDAEEQPSEEESRAGRLANWIWVVFVLVIILAHVLSGLRD